MIIIYIIIEVEKDSKSYYGTIVLYTIEWWMLLGVDLPTVTVRYNILTKWVLIGFFVLAE